MSRPRCVLILAFLSVLSAAPAHAAAAEPPKISKPKPAPPAPPGAVPALPPAVFDPTLAVGGSDVKARKIETRLSVDVKVNGSGPYHFIVDSGADTSVVGLRIAHDLQLPLGSPAVLNGMTSRNIVDRVKVAELNLGPTTIKNVELPALKEYDLGGDGMLGIDALTQQRLMMDFEHKLIKVEDASTPEKFYPGDIVITARRKRGQLILTHVTAVGLPLDAVIDTGSEITIGNLALRDKLLPGNREKFIDVTAIDVSGVPSHLQVAKIAELQLGPVVLTDVPMAFADVPPFKLFGLSDEPAILLGTDVLETFRKVSLDFRARKVRFQLRSCRPQGVILSTSDDATYTRLFSRGGLEVCAD